MKKYIDILGTDEVKDSREVINNNIKTVASDFSGTAFPTENLVEGMTCYRTDQKKLYRYITVDSTLAWVVDRTYSVNGQTIDANGNIKLEDYVTKLTVKGTTVTVTKKDGTTFDIVTQDTTYSNATQTANGLMSSADKTRLDGIVIPTSLPANGGNADTLDNLHASSFLQLSNGFLPSPVYIAHQNTETEGGEIRFQKADGNADMCLDAWQNHFRFIYNGSVNLDISYLGIFAGGYSKQSNGYNTLPNGFIIQWGTVSNSNVGYDTVTFPVTFNQLFSVVTKSAYRGSEGAGDERYIEWQNNAQFRAGHDSGGFNWIAVGI